MVFRFCQRGKFSYTYGVRRIDSIDNFESSDNHATLTVTITESRTLHQGGKQKRSGETSKTTFDLVDENGLIKIADIRSK
jgi:serine/threonine-protein kinase